jgi:antitoxin (DNA-binding transcriptional repressor) of toxin-antitoxin stability system
MPYTVHQAKTNFSRLIKEAEAGKEVIVMRGKKPVAKITAIQPPPKPNVPFRLMGGYPDISWTPDAFDPLTDEELKEMGFDYLVDVPLTPMPEKPASEK